MKKQMIEVEGLPEGWKAIAFRSPKSKEHYFSPSMDICLAEHNYLMEHLIIKKIKPRRIVLEETCETRPAALNEWYEYGGKVWRWDSAVKSARDFKIWSEVKETDISLTNDLPKLSLSVDECKYILGRSSKYAGNVFDKMGEFIKENS